MLHRRERLTCTHVDRMGHLLATRNDPVSDFSTFRRRFPMNKKPRPRQTAAQSESRLSRGAGEKRPERNRRGLSIYMRASNLPTTRNVFIDGCLGLKDTRRRLEPRARRTRESERDEDDDDEGEGSASKEHEIHNAGGIVRRAFLHTILAAADALYCYLSK